MITYYFQPPHHTMGVSWKIPYTYTQYNDVVVRVIPRVGEYVSRSTPVPDGQGCEIWSILGSGFLASKVTRVQHDVQTGDISIFLETNNSDNRITQMTISGHEYND